MEKDPRTFAIIGAAMAVHRELGPGFLEAVYQEALAIELGRRAIPARAEVVLPVWYGSIPLRQRYRADFVCHDAIVVELKAMDSCGPREVAQLANYLKVTRLPLGLLLNFGSTSLQFLRVIGRHQEPIFQTQEAYAEHEMGTVGRPPP